MKKIFSIVLFLVFTLSSCSLFGEQGNVSDTVSSETPDESSSVISESKIEYSSYDPFLTADFHGFVIQYDFIMGGASAKENNLLEHNDISGCIALVTLTYVDVDNAIEELRSEEYTETYCSTPVTVRIDRVLFENDACDFTAGEDVTFCVNDRWTEQTNEKSCVEYDSMSFPIAETERQYVVKLQQIDGECYGEVLSFPINSDGSYTENILELKDSDCFRKEQWSFSDEVLKRYGIIE